MSLDDALGLARDGRLYPAIILHGASSEERREAATRIGRTLLCERDQAERPCGDCRHCRRISAGEGHEGFHPDFHLLERDQKTVTSIEATRGFLRAAVMAPFEGRGQVFVISSAETLGPEAADTLLKILEEPPPRTPRHFLLLAPSNRELAPTLRSRSMAIFLGADEGVDEQQRDAIAEAFASNVALYLQSGNNLHLLTAAAELQKAGGWADLRAAAPWSLAAAAVVRSVRVGGFEGDVARSMLGLGAALLEAREQRVRGIMPQRILEGLVVRHLGGGRVDVEFAAP